MREKYDCQIGICCRKAIKQRTLCQNNVFLDCHPVSRYFQVWRDRTFFSNDTIKRERKKNEMKKEGSKSHWLSNHKSNNVDENLQLIHFRTS